MSDAQVITIVLSTIVLLAGILFNNARIGDLKETLRAEMRADRAETKSDIAILRSETNARFDRLEAKIDTILKLMADMESRTTRLEERHYSQSA